VNLLAINLCAVCQLLVVISQIFFKHAMAPYGQTTPGRPGARMVWFIFLGIVLQSLWFFLWLGILAKWALSQAFPFEGLNPVLVVLAAWLFLRERVAWTAWLGIGLIAAGIVIVSQSS
jgi:undecaprenyl phosphate-alpha-L-ara4N flippase subunit ArnE